VVDVIRPMTGLHRTAIDRRTVLGRSRAFPAIRQQLRANLRRDVTSSNALKAINHSPPGKRSTFVGDLESFTAQTHVHALVQRKISMAKNEKTGRAAASAAGRTLSNPLASAAAKSAAGSALTQRGSNEVTSKAAASKAAKTLSSATASKAAKSAAGSALAQRPGRRGR
jgi:hypothetical protein